MKKLLFLLILSSQSIFFGMETDLKQPPIIESSKFQSESVEALLNALNRGDNNFVNYNANVIDQAKKKYGEQTLIRLAAMNSTPQIFEKFVPTSKQVRPNFFGMTPLHYAVLNGNVDTAEYLIEKSNDINSSNNYGYTAYDFAHNLGSENIKKLFSNKADIQNPKVISTEQLFFMAAQYGAKKTIEDVLKNNKIDVNIKDVYGETALYKASRNGHKEAVELLLDHGVDVNSKDIFWGRTAFDLASRNGHKEVVNLLWKKTSYYSKLSYVIKNNPIKTAVALTLPIIGAISYWYWRK
ncbi:MAG: ankyrin repeat domain-containing protein [Candidatus Babeliales bacterium]